MIRMDSLFVTTLKPNNTTSGLISLAIKKTVCALSFSNVYGHETGENAKVDSWG